MVYPRLLAPGKRACVSRKQNHPRASPWAAWHLCSPDLAGFDRCRQTTTNTRLGPLRRQTLADLLRRTAARFPDKLGIRCGATAWTWREFDAVVSRLAAGLHLEGFAAGDRVAVLARNSRGFAALRFALARLGAVLVPVNFMLNADEAAYILRHAGARLLAVDSELADLGRNAAARDTKVQRLLWLPSEQLSQPIAGALSFDTLAACAGAPPEPAIDRDDLLQVVYTSGTESAPKGAMLSHGAVIDQYVSCIVDGEMSDADSTLHA